MYKRPRPPQPRIAGFLWVDMEVAGQFWAGSVQGKNVAYLPTTTQAQLNEVKANQKRTADTLRTQINRAKATLNQIAEVRPVDG